MLLSLQIHCPLHHLQELMWKVSEANEEYSHRAFFYP